MAGSLLDRLQNAYNAFRNRDPTSHWQYAPGYSSSHRPDQVVMHYSNEKSIIASVFNQIANDVASIKIQHVRLDQNGRFKEVIDSSLNEVLTLSTNKDQIPPEFIRDAVISMFDEGTVALVPVDLSVNPNDTGSYQIESLRTAEVREWFPDHVRLWLYNDRKGIREELILPKKMVAIIQNPLYTSSKVGTLFPRLARKLAQLDQVDNVSSSGKLDLIIQLPYTIKTPARKLAAEERRKDIEVQLTNSKYGIAYADASEKITQLNRAVDNNLLEQVKNLTTQVYNQLGLTESIFNGTADEATFINYFNRTIEPILTAFTLEMKRKFLTRTAISQGQSIEYYRDPFRLVPVSQLAEIADKFTRNEILTSNEMRAEVGYKPVDDPRADELRNKNLNAENDQLPKQLPESKSQNESKGG